MPPLPPFPPPTQSNLQPDSLVAAAVSYLMAWKDRCERHVHCVRFNHSEKRKSTVRDSVRKKRKTKEERKRILSVES